MNRLSMIAVGCAVLMLSAGAQAAGDQRALLDFTSCAKPVYPEEAVKSVREGTVNLQFLVKVDGTVGDSKVIASSGHPDLDQAALSALGKCKFVAATKKGKPVQEWTKVQYKWTLK